MNITLNITTKIGDIWCFIFYLYFYIYTKNYPMYCLYEMLSIQNVILTKCNLYEMLPIQSVLYKMLPRQNVTIRKCTIQNVTDPG